MTSFESALAERLEGFLCLHELPKEFQKFYIVFITTARNKIIQEISNSSNFYYDNQIDLKNNEFEDSEKFVLFKIIKNKNLADLIYERVEIRNPEAKLLLDSFFFQILFAQKDLKDILATILSDVGSLEDFENPTEEDLVREFDIFI